MSGWIVILAIAGSFSISDVKVMQTSGEAQCKQIVDELRPLQGHVSVVCFGPDGEVWK